MTGKKNNALNLLHVDGKNKGVLMATCPCFLVILRSYEVELDAYSLEAEILVLLYW